MLRKLTIALVATASIAAAALAPTAASAKFGGLGGGGFHHHHHHFGGFVGVVGIGDADDGCYVTRRVLTPYGYRLQTVNVCAF
jgi:hypothetical protein